MSASNRGVARVSRRVGPFLCQKVPRRKADLWWVYCRCQGKAYISSDSHTDAVDVFDACQ